MKEKTLNAARIIVLSAVFASAIGYSLADWVPPPQPPPFGNTPPPINVGGATQVKSGTLMIDQWLVAGKARVRESTVAGDSGKVLVTKDYVDGLGYDGTGNAGWYGSQGKIASWSWGASGPACLSTNDHASCPAGTIVVGIDSCVGGRAAVLCGTLRF